MVAVRGEKNVFPSERFLRNERVSLPVDEKTSRSLENDQLVDVKKTKNEAKKIFVLLEKVQQQKSEQQKGLVNQEIPQKRETVLNNIKDFAGTYLDYLLRPTTTLSSEKIRFLHYPQVLFSLPIAALSILLPQIESVSLAFTKEMGAIFVLLYSLSLLFSILESKNSKKKAIVLDGSLDIIPIFSPYKKTFLNGKVVTEKDMVGELHWDPKRRVKNEKDQKLLVLKTKLSFLDSFIDLIGKAQNGDQQLLKLTAIKITSELVGNDFDKLGAETQPLTNNPLLATLDHLTTRVNIMLNGRFKQAILNKIHTSKTAWFTFENLKNPATLTYLESQKKSLEKAIGRRETQLEK